MEVTKSLFQRYIPNASTSIEVTPNDLLLGITSEDMWYKIVIPNDSTLEVYTTSDVDTKGVLYDDAYNILKYSDYDIKTDTENFRMTISLSKGTYYLNVEQYAPIGTYDLYINSYEDDNNSVLGARLLSLNSNYPSVNDYYNDKDYYEFTITEPKTIYIYAEGPKGLVGHLFNENNDLSYVSYYNELSTGLYRFGFEMALEPDTYYIEVYNFLDEFGSYELYITDCQTIIEDEGSTYWNPQVITLNSILNGTIDYPSDEDYYQLTLNEAKTFYVYTENVSFLMGTLSTSSMYRNDYYSPIEYVEYQLEAGTYLLTITSTEVQNYKLHIVEEIPILIDVIEIEEGVESVVVSNEEQWFKFYALEAETFNIYSTQGVDTEATMYNQYFNYSQYSTTYGGYPSFNIQNNGPMVFYIHVRLEDPTASYQVIVDYLFI